MLQWILRIPLARLHDPCMRSLPGLLEGYCPTLPGGMKSTKSLLYSIFRYFVGQG